MITFCRSGHALAYYPIDEVRNNLLARDHTDSTRKEGPLRQAEDAILLDNSDMTREEQLHLVLSWARKRMGIE